MIISNLIPALGWTLLHSLWQGGVLFLLMFPLFQLLKDRSPQLRYGIACTALLLLLGTMTWTFSSQLEFSITGPELEVDSATASAKSNTMFSENTALPVEVNSGADISSATNSGSTAFSPSHFIEANVYYLVAFWGLGVLIFTFRWFHMLLLTFRLRNRGTRNLPPVWRERLLRLKQRMGVDQVISLVESSNIDTPLVIGYFKPVILLPIGLVNGLSAAQVEAILAHELAHIKRHDFLVNVLLTSLEVVLFYHPVYWWLADRINQEREKCCDDVAVAACGNPRMYARTLLSVEEHRQSGILALAFAKEGGQLQNRILRICQTAPRQNHSFSLRLWLLLPLLGCVAAFAYAGVMPITAEDVSEAPSEQINQTDNLSPEAVLAFKAELNTPTDVMAADEGPLTTATKNQSLASPIAATSIEVPKSSPASPVSVPAIEAVPAEAFPVTFDSLPEPSVPRLASNPRLPTPPTFLLTEKEVTNLLAKGEEGRKQLRKQTDEYRDKIGEWNDRVNEEYLQSWEDHRIRIMEAYENWSSELRAQSGDDLTFALAHNRQSELFEEALNLNEGAMEKVEDAIEDQPEFDTEGLERVIERGEKSIREHDERMQVHGVRMSMHGVRMKIHGGRMKVHSGRMQMHSARMKLHSNRMENHQIIMAALEADLREALIADGLLGKNEERFRFEVTNEAMLFNGKVIDPISLEPKYRAILARYGQGNLGENSGNTFVIEITNNGRKIGTRYDRN